MCDLMMYYETQKIAVKDSPYYDMFIIVLFCDPKIRKDTEPVTSVLKCQTNCHIVRKLRGVTVTAIISM